MRDQWDRWQSVILPDAHTRNEWAEEYTDLYQWFPQLRRLYTQWEIDFEWLEGWVWVCNNSPWLPLGICAVYLAFCYFGQRAMASRKPFDLKYPLIAWNFGLALFSTIGALRTMPHLLFVLYKFGFKYTICFKPSVWYGSGAVGWWTQAFVLSKIPELGDTVFIVLRKKPLIFLHWYHHVTVLLYCWHSYYEQTTYGLYFIAMNYTVHAFMYLYYALAAMRIRLCKPYYITAMQISQMFVGIGVCVAGGYYISKGETQYISIENFWAGVIMYTSYAALFLQYAIGRFIKARFGRAKRESDKLGHKAEEEDSHPDHPAVLKATKRGAGATANGVHASNGAATNGKTAVANGNGKTPVKMASVSNGGPAKRTRSKAE